MKKIFLITGLLLTISISAFAYYYPRFCQTDWKCVNDCVSAGYQWGYCKAICTWCQ